MNAFTESIRFWETLDHLVNREGMRLVHLNEREEVAWIEDDRRDSNQIIRLAHKNYDWSNQLKKDIDQHYDQAKKIRKKLGLKKANVTSVILSAFMPVDDYERLTSQALPFTAGGKNHFRTIIIPLEDMKKKLFPLATEWKLTEMPPFLSESYLEESGQEEQFLQTLKKNVNRSMRNRQEKERKIFLYGKPYFTLILLGMVLSIFALVEMEGSTTSTLTLIEFGAKFDPLILQGEWWRFFSAMFLHIGFLHLFMNSLALFYLGGAVERIFGTSRFVLIYFIAGFFGSVSSFVFNDNVSAGASGAIFGCFGALLYFGMIHRRLFFRTMGMNVIVILVINLSFGFIVPMVDNGAHIGGLLGGFVASAIVGLPKQKGSVLKLIALTLAVLIAGILLWFGYDQDSDSEQISTIYYQLARESIEEEEFDDAKTYLANVIDSSEQLSDELLSNAYFLLSYTQMSLEELEEAEENLLITIEISPSFHQAYYNLALIYYENQELHEALELVESALEIDAGNEDYQALRDEIHQLIES